MTAKILRLGTVLSLVMTLFLMSVSPSEAAFVRFTAGLRGSLEVPGPGDPNGSGVAIVKIDVAAGRLCYRLIARNIVLPADGAHIHRGRAGVAGDIVVTLKPPNANGGSVGCVNLGQPLLMAIRNNPANYYVNIHTSDFAAGAIRGQLKPG